MNLAKPEPDLAAQIVARDLAATVVDVTRFRTGLSHFVFEVSTLPQGRFVVRLALPQRRGELEDGLYWHKKLAALGMTLPALLGAGRVAEYAYAIYERLPGEDLENVYHELSTTQRVDIAGAVARSQQVTMALEDRRLKDSQPWAQTIRDILDRSERELRARSRSIPAIVRQARDYFSGRELDLNRLNPFPFLYDTGLRNVLVHDGRFSGFIDVDEMWVGDPVLAVGRSKTLLLLSGWEIDFIDTWSEALALDAYGRQRIDWYALLYCIRFLGTSGLALNGNPSVQTDESVQPRLKAIAEALLATMDR